MQRIPTKAPMRGEAKHLIDLPEAAVIRDSFRGYTTLLQLNSKLGAYETKAKQR